MNRKDAKTRSNTPRTEIDLISSRPPSRLRAFVVPLLCLILLTACHQSPPSTQHAEKPVKGRAQLWQENCNTCHNARSARHYSDEQWEIAMHHMRSRFQITSKEHKSILEFLQATE